MIPNKNSGIKSVRKEKKISVIVPCYNHSIYLIECLNSVLEQSYTNWECIVVDDGSNDNPYKVVEPFLKDDRFRFYRKQNGGLSNTRNYAIEKSTGDFILPLDSDDKIDSEYLYLAMQAYQEDENIDLIYCKVKFFGDDNKFWNLPPYDYKKILSKNIIFCSAIFKRSKFLEGIKYDVNLKYGYEDWDFWLQLLDEKSKVYRIDKVCFFYRTKQESMVSFTEDKAKKTYTENYIYAKHEKKISNLFSEQDCTNFDFVRGYLENEKNKLKLKRIKKSIVYKTLVKLELFIRGIKKV